MTDVYATLRLRQSSRFWRQQMTTNLPALSMKDVETMANVATRSGLFGIKDPMQAMALMLLCQAEGLHPMVACRQYHVIQGRAAMTSQTMMSKFLSGGGRQEIHELSDTVADITLSHPAGGSARIRWTIEQARSAGLVGKDNWKNHPRSMLLRRAQAEAVRAVAPFVLEGIPSADEAEEIEPINVLEAQKPDIDISKISEVAALKEPPVEVPLDKTWDRETKARATREAKRLGGTVTKEGMALIPNEAATEFQAFVDELAFAHFVNVPANDTILA